MHRWKHGYTTDNPDLIFAEDIFWEDIINRQVDLTLPNNGQLAVAGYVETKKFSHWIKNGKDGVGEIIYRL